MFHLILSTYNPHKSSNQCPFSSSHQKCKATAVYFHSTSPPENQPPLNRPISNRRFDSSSSSSRDFVILIVIHAGIWKLHLRPNAYWRFKRLEISFNACTCQRCRIKSRCVNHIEQRNKSNTLRGTIYMCGLLKDGFIIFCLMRMSAL